MTEIYGGIEENNLVLEGRLEMDSSYHRLNKEEDVLVLVGEEQKVYKFCEENFVFKHNQCYCN